jgi:hypothetical protein
LKSIFLFCSGLLIQQIIFCQPYWQQETNYTIDVRLNDSSHSLDGFLKLEYINHSPDTISFIWFHLWPNAFKNDRTAFSEQLLQNGRTDFYFSDKEQRGYINRLDFRTNNNTLKTEDHRLYIDVIKVYLLKPLPPGNGMEITTPFHVKIPKNFSRGGRTGRSYQITQWYPKPAVYDRKGWHPMPYLEQGEFYSEFGNFDVRITLPESYIVAATGELQNAGEENTGRGVQSTEVDRKQDDTEVIKPKVKNQGAKKKTTSSKKAVAKSSAKSKSSSPKNKTPSLNSSLITQSGLPVEYKTLQYKQSNVHDFAWFADKKFIVKQDTIELVSGKVINAYSYYTSKDNKGWQNSLQYIKDAIRFRSAAMGEYPYKTVSVVEAKMGFEGGMEYPTITSISGADDAITLEETIEHEIGHNWLYGILATNERDNPWMDEGINSYYDARYNEWKYGKKRPATDNWIGGKMPDNFEQVLVNAYSRHKLDQPISTASHQFDQVNYFLIAYSKTARWMKKLEDSIGRDVLDSCMREYYRAWQFKHPYREDFQKLLQSCTDKDLRQYFMDLDLRGPVHQQSRKIKPVFLFSFKETDKFNYLNILPAAGYNKYDGFMIGALLYNYNLPSSRFQFVAVPLYATGSKQLNGTGSVSYSWFPDNAFQRIQLGVGGARFSTLTGLDSNNNKIFGGFSKITPTLRVTLANQTARSTLEKWIEWKTFLIGERGFNYIRKSADSMYYPTEGTVQNRYLNQLVFSITDYRALYPYDVQLQLQQGAGFYRANAIANYFYNYAKGGGMHIRFFAAKFGYIGSRTVSKEFETAVYQPKLTGVRGNEDYTYSNYFIGRNESEYFLSQQIMLRDGALKLRTDLFQGLQGRSDNWVSSLNFNTTLPEKLFPVKLPLRIFFDIGTYAEAWKKDAATSRFLYVGGLQVSLFKNLLNIYAPLIYSSEFRDNLKTVPGENKFFQRLSFSFDVHRLNWRRIVGYKVPL